jgi:hypothetical protein
MDQKPTTENEECGENEDLHPVSQKEKATETTQTTVLEEQPTRPEESNVVPIRNWPPEELIPYPKIADMVLDLTERFFPSTHLIEITSSEIFKLGCISQPESDEIAKSVVERALLHWLTHTIDQQWRLRLEYIFDNKYPEQARECWYIGRLANVKYEKPSVIVSQPYTFNIKTIDIISKPEHLLCSRIAPLLYIVELNSRNEPTVEPTADVYRFHNSEKEAVPKSSLFEENIFNRPAYGIETGWDNYNSDRLPRKIVAAEILCSTNDEMLFAEFVTDLKVTFAWPDTNDTNGFLAVYIGYLIQPLISHLMPGMMPAYCFLGPTKSGKGYLSNVLPAVFYHRYGESCVTTKKIPKEIYEFEVLMEASKNALYICFDETKNASDEELKMIDAFCTQSEIVIRKFRVGYYQLPNLYTVSATAVHRTFSDETYGRMSIIKLKESRPENISAFHQKWRLKGPQLLKCLFEKVSKVKVDFDCLPKVSDRRPGFGLVAHFLKEAFSLTPDYSIEATNCDVLDDLCRLFELESHLGSPKGPWMRFSPRSFTQFMAKNQDIKWKRSNALAAINTALGYTSTRSHPIFKDTGYPAESGRHYHIELREEGERSKRVLIYIQPLNQQDDLRSQALAASKERELNKIGLTNE